MKKGIVFLLGLLLVLPVVANADVISYSTILNGANEAPPNASPGTGSALIVIDTLAHTMNVEATFSGLIGNTTAAHIHGPTDVAGAGNASVATQTPTFTGFPLGVTSGTYTHLFDLTLVSTYRAGFIADNGGTAAGAEAALLAAIAEGKAYFNIHTNAFPGGEIRGFLAPTGPHHRRGGRDPRWLAPLAGDSHSGAHPWRCFTDAADGCAFVGDTLFAGSVGRTDFPGGDFDTLKSSIQKKLFALGDEVRVFTGHGPETTIGEEKRYNPFVGLGAR